jgi:hypothetical protein
MRLERDYKIDKEKIQQYFPCDVVIQGVLDLYQELLDLRFTLTPHPHVSRHSLSLFSPLLSYPILSLRSSCLESHSLISTSLNHLSLYFLEAYSP